MSDERDSRSGGGADCRLLILLIPRLFNVTVALYLDLPGLFGDKLR